MLKLSDRTFGMEIEYGDVVRANVPLPAGYKWSKEEKSIVNSNAKKSTPTGDIGGEVNTRPLLPIRKDVREVRRFIKQCFDSEGLVMWNTGFDGHLFVGDCGLEELKKIFALGFFVSPLINEIFGLGEWFNVEHLVPTPTYYFYERVQNAQTIEALKNIFANSSNVGHYRFQINIMSFFKTQTVEFRIFNGTKNFRQTLETIKFMYSFVDYALTHDEKDFKKIKTVDDFIKVFDIKKPFAKSPAPLIFAESHKIATSNIAKGFPPSRKLVSAISTSTPKKIATVNPFDFALEVGLYREKDLAIYNNSEYNDVIHKICTKQIKSIEYFERFSILNEYRDHTAETELALLQIFKRIQKYNLTTDYGAKEFNAYVSKIKESVAKLSISCKEFLDMFSACEYHRGTLDDAINDAMDVALGRNTIVFQQEMNSKANSAITALKKFSDYQSDFSRKDMSYKNIEERVKTLENFMVVSKNDFLPFNKVAKDIDTTLYSTNTAYKGLRTNNTSMQKFTFEIPPDDYEITEKTNITIQEIMPVNFSVLQHTFVKKVTKFKTPKICYVVLDGNIILGAFGFDYSKDANYTMFLLSDFCTNNNVRLLSKFILFVIKSKELKQMLEKKLVERVKNSYTRIYTTNAVSMKYRGAFQKVKTDSEKYLTYDFQFGEGGTLQDAKREYLKRIKQ